MGQRGNSQERKRVIFYIKPKVAIIIGLIEITHNIKIRPDKSYVPVKSIEIEGLDEIPLIRGHEPVPPGIEAGGGPGQSSGNDPSKLHNYRNVFRTAPNLISGVFDTGEEIDIGTVSLNQNQILFKYIAMGAESIILNFNIDERKISRIIGNTGRALIKQALDPPLEKNSVYQFHFYSDDVVFETEFKTELDPFFATVKQIRQDTGIALGGVTDETIADMIHHNSILALESWNILNSDELGGAGAAMMDQTDYSYGRRVTSTTRPFLTPAGSTTGTVFTNMHQWVRFKTAIDLLMAVYYGIATNLGDISKRIGTVNVSKGTKLPYLKDLLDELRKRLLEIEKEIFGSRIIAHETLKAGDTPYPRLTPRPWEEVT